MPTIFRTKASVSDLREMWMHIAKDSVIEADRFVQELDERLETLAQFPSMGKNRTTLARDLYSFPFGNVLVFYMVEHDLIQIVRILQGARDLRPELFIQDPKSL